MEGEFPREIVAETGRLDERVRFKTREQWEDAPDDRAILNSQGQKVEMSARAAALKHWRDPLSDTFTAYVPEGTCPLEFDF